MITDVKSLINNLLVLNPNSQLKEDKTTPPVSDADARVQTTLDIKDIKLPGGFYIDENGNISNKIVENIPYVTIEVETVEKVDNINEYIDKQVEELNKKYPGIVDEETKENAKNVFASSTDTLENQMHEVDLIVQQTTIKYLENLENKVSTEPTITEARKTQKNEKRLISISPVEKNIYTMLKAKKEIKAKPKPKVPKLKKEKKPSKFLSSKGFTNLMYISVIVIIILVMYIILTY